MKSFLRNSLSGRLARLAASLLAVLWLPCLCGAAENQPVIRSGDGLVTELWQGKVLTASFRAGMCFEKDGKARGVLILRHSNGHEDVYHLYGTMKNGQFSLSHGSGHEFSGSLADPEMMEGKVRLANGMRLSLKGKRLRHAPLAAADCAPLQK